MKSFTLAVAAAGAASALALAAPAYATTFADYSATSSNANLVWTRTDASHGSMSTTGVGDTASVYFSFLNPTLSSLANIGATFTLSATSTGAAFTDTSGDLVQPDLSGTFSFVSTSAFTVGGKSYAAGTNLLSGAFSGAEILGQGSAGVTKDSVLSGGTVTFTSGIDSSLLSFSGAPGSDRGFSLELTSTTPIYAKQGHVLRSFSADSTGSFSATLSRGGGQGIPEPAAWSMMLVGFGLAGYALRRRRFSATLA
ncbi:MAG TPA: PEPxxWA-CTERM sorting domain-containing protein [Caulobacteraceae bacterium]|nr:PEPxxWA-CTERM sorting domain-containing protein [Caulobacteraceae bacterium]